MSVEHGGGQGRNGPPDLYRKYGAALFDYCQMLLRDPAAAADAVLDTVLAAAPAAEPEDPDQARAELYAAARRRCLRQPGRHFAAAGQAVAAAGATARAAIDRRGDRPGGFGAAAPAAAGSAYPGAADADTAALEVAEFEAEARAETLRVVTTAFEGLPDRDREVLSLAFRHRVWGADLAAVLGISPRRARARLSAASSRFEKLAAAVVVLSAAWPGCEALESIAGIRDRALGRPAPKVRRRLTRHVSSCDSCAASGGTWIFGPELLGGVPIAEPPAALRQRIRAVSGRPGLATAPGRAARQTTDTAGAFGGVIAGGAPANGAVAGTGRTGGASAAAGAAVADASRGSARRWLKLRLGQPRAVAAGLAAVVVLIAGAGLLYKITSAPAGAHGATTAAVAAGPRTHASLIPALASRTRPRPVAARHPAFFPFPWTPSGAPVSVPPVLLPPPGNGPSPSPSPPGSRSPSPSPSPSRTSHSPSPSPSPTSPSPSPSTTSPSPSPSTTSPSPSPSTTSPSPSPTSPSPT